MPPHIAQAEKKGRGLERVLCGSLDHLELVRSELTNIFWFRRQQPLSQC
jgi:hypothetical protein